jgi:hypothetical protein
MSEASNNSLWRQLGKLEARMGRAERDIRKLQRKPPRDPVQLKELMPYILALGALIAVIAGKMTLAEAVTAGLLGR